MNVFRATLLSNISVQIWACTLKLEQLPVSWWIIDLRRHATDTTIDENLQIEVLSNSDGLNLGRTSTVAHWHLGSPSWQHGLSQRMGSMQLFTWLLLSAITTLLNLAIYGPYLAPSAKHSASVIASQSHFHAKRPRCLNSICTFFLL